MVRRLFQITLILVVSLWCLGALAGDDDKKKCRKKHSEKEYVTLVGDDGQHLSIRMSDNNVVTIISEDGTESEIFELNLEDLGETIDIAMTEVSEVIEDLNDMQLDLRLGRDNRFLLDFDGEEYEVDLDEIMYEIGDVMGEVFADLDLDFDDLDLDLDFDSDFEDSEWDNNYSYAYDEDDEEILEEILALQEEIESLKRELRELKGRRSR